MTFSRIHCKFIYEFSLICGDAMIGLIDVSQDWQKEAKEAYLAQDESKFYDLDTQIKGSFMLALLKSRHKKLKEINSLLIHFFAWVESPRREKWEKGWQTIYGWHALLEVAEVLYKDETIAQTVLEVTKRKHFREILITVVKGEFMRQSDLAKQLDLQENNLLPKIDDLIEMQLVEKQKVSGAAFIKPTSRGFTVVDHLKEQEEVKYSTNIDFIESLLDLLANLERQDDKAHMEPLIDDFLGKNKIVVEAERTLLIEFFDSYIQKIKKALAPEPIVETSLVHFDYWEKTLLESLQRDERSYISHTGRR